MQLSIIVAVSENGIIGKDNQLIWHLPDDLKRFKKLTLGHPIIMGRKTFESIGKPLPGRISIVVTRNPDFKFDGVEVAHSLEEAVQMAERSGAEESFVIGGGELYRLAFPLAQDLFVTEVKTVVNGDARFEIKNPEHWIETERTVHRADDKHDYEFDFVNYVKQENK